MFGKIKRFGIARPFRCHDFNDGWDNFARLFNHHGVADADVFAFDFVFIVQRRASNSASTHQYRLKHCYRRENSRAPHLNHDVVQAGLHPFGLIFVSDGPTRRFRCETEALALRK
jgi:hypothetical protein